MAIPNIEGTFRDFELHTVAGVNKAFTIMGNYVFTNPYEVLPYFIRIYEAAEALNYENGAWEGVYYLALLGFLTNNTEMYRIFSTRLEGVSLTQSGAKPWWYMLQAAIAREKGEPNETRELYRITYELAEEQGLALLEARARFNYAATFDSGKEKTPRLEALKGIKLDNLEDQLPGLAAHMYMQTAQALSNAAMHKQALAYIDSSIKLAQQALSPHGIAQCLIEKGLILIGAGQNDEAIAAFNVVHDVVEDGDLISLIPAGVNLTELYRVINNREKAWQILLQTEELIGTNEEFKYPKMVLESIKGALLAEEGKLDAAQPIVENTIPYLIEQHRLQELAAAYDTLCNIFKQRKDYQSALQTMEKIRAVEKEMAEERQAEQVADIEITNRMQEAEAERRRAEELRIEKERSENLLLNILPEEVAEELKQSGSAKAKLFNDVTVLFTDFKSFTIVSERLTPEELVNELHACFSGFDNIIDQYGLEKIKTVGDAYLAVSGLPVANKNHAANMVEAALAIRNFMIDRRKQLGNKTFEIRIGLHSGSVVAGIVGVKKFAYDIWGDTVNTAARMEQNGEAGKVNVSEATYDLVKHKFATEYRGELEAKNKGKLRMYFVEPKTTAHWEAFT